MSETSPRLNVLDRGKARVSLPDEVAGQLMGMITAVTAKWTKRPYHKGSSAGAKPNSASCDAFFMFRATSTSWSSTR